MSFSRPRFSSQLSGGSTARYLACGNLPLQSDPLPYTYQVAAQTDIKEVQGKGGKLSERIGRIKAMVETALVKDTLRTCRERHYDRMMQNSPSSISTWAAAPTSSARRS
jgi:hypothetical protein